MIILVGSTRTVDCLLVATKEASLILCWAHSKTSIYVHCSFRRVARLLLSSGVTININSRDFKAGTMSHSDVEKSPPACYNMGTLCST